MRGAIGERERVAWPMVGSWEHIESIFHGKWHESRVEQSCARLAIVPIQRVPVASVRDLSALGFHVLQTADTLMHGQNHATMEAGSADNMSPVNHSLAERDESAERGQALLQSGIRGISKRACRHGATMLVLGPLLEGMHACGVVQTSGSWPISEWDGGTRVEWSTDVRFCRPLHVSSASKTERGPRLNKAASHTTELS